MATNNYQTAKDFIYGKLKKITGPLPQNRIREEIESTKSVIAAVGERTFAQILSVEEFTNLFEDDWERMIKEFEEHFDVKLAKGVLIQGDDQRQRDTLWWSSVYKQKSSNYYWDRYNKYLTDSMPPDVIKTIDDDTDIVMNNIENPSEPSFARYGMVVGHVQSGKTGNYSALICKAADAGYKFIVVIAGGINNLRNQTQQRLNESFIGQTKGVQVGAGKGNTSNETLPLSLTTVERDFNKQDADRLSQGLNFDNISVPILLVIKKSPTTLGNVVAWLQNVYKNKVKHAMLVVDDESDYASINTKEEDDPTVINKKIRQLLSMFDKSSYVAYTATPYANIFIDHKAHNSEYGRDLFPKDFIYALDAPTNYFGASKIFLSAAGDRHLVAADDYKHCIPPDHNKEFQLNCLPPTLLEAIRVFLLNISIRHLRGQDKKHNSMLIHATRFTDVHKKIAGLTEQYFDDLKKDVSAYAKLPLPESQSSLIQDLSDTFALRLQDIEFLWDDVIKKMAEAVESVVIREVHQKTKVPLEYRDDVPTNAIVIGGTSLARGYTIEGLSVSYFLRNTVFYDTLMQMGRWFGYRPGYEDLCRIYMPEERITDFADIIHATEQLFKDFKLMAEHSRTPEEFGLAVQQNPDSILQVTARNKQKHVQTYLHSMQLDGQSKETAYLRSNKLDMEKNIAVIKSLLDELPQQQPESNGIYVWRNIEREKVKKFLADFRTFAGDRLGLTTRMPIKFIEQYVEENGTLWDIALYNGTGETFQYQDIKIKKEKRQFKLKQNGKINQNEGYYEVLNRQVSSGNSESVAIEDPTLRKTIGNDRRKARENMERPLLMLHILEQKFAKNESPTPNPIKEIAAFGVSFPGSVLTNQQTVQLKINTVMYENLIKEMQSDDEEDD